MQYKKFPVKFSDSCSFHKRFDDGTEIGGSYKEPAEIILLLNEKEFKELCKLIGKSDELNLIPHGIFKSKVFTDWHRRVIVKTFPQVYDFKVEILCIGDYWEGRKVTNCK